VPEATPAAIVDAALEVLEEGGLEELTMQRVAQRANLSVGSIYNYVTDKDELLTAAHEKFLERIAASDRFAAVPDAGTPAATVGAVIAELVSLMRTHEPLIRAFGAQGVRDPAIAARGSEQSRRLSRSFSTRLLALRGEIAAANPDLAVDVCFRLVYDTAARTISHGPGFAAEQPLDWSTLVDELTVACTAYLLDGA
jgi:AcrR family transcriptional regulator